MLLNLGYASLAMALLAKKGLRLRMCLAIAYSAMVFYGYTYSHWTVMTWNLLFITINLAHAYFIYLAKYGVKIPQEGSFIYQGAFSTMTQQEFLHFWNSGSLLELKETTIIKKGEHPQFLYIVVDGELQVVQDGLQINKLIPCNFISEMSILTNGTASADVIATDRVQVMSWDISYLEKAEINNPAMFLKIQGAIARDLVNKLKQTSCQKTA